jgi:hypothetical protein
MAMVDVIRADEMSRLSVCADPTCGGIVVDLSRNRSRRFCSTTAATAWPWPPTGRGAADASSRILPSRALEPLPSAV